VSSTGTVRIEPGRAIDVDVIQPEPLQRVGQECRHRSGSRIIARPAARRIAQRAELRADLEAVARHAPQRLADQHLVVAHAVEVAGVEEGNTGVERGVDGGNALGPVGRAIHARHAHAPKAKGGNHRTAGHEVTLLHGLSPVSYAIAGSAAQLRSSRRRWDARR
jgi:hypothetical protein